MNLFLCFLLVQLITTWATGQPVRQATPLSDEPGALVQSLYQQVVARHPLGIPYGADMKIFEPYLSKTLLHRFAVNNACFADWRRQNPDPSLKPPVGLIEDGLFSGANEKAEPQAFHIEGTESTKDDSFRVYVRLTWGTPPDKPLIWRVAVVLVRESGHPVVDDVIYLKDKSHDTESRLSENLSAGCDGPRWVGHADHDRDPGQ